MAGSLPRPPLMGSALRKWPEVLDLENHTSSPGSHRKLHVLVCMQVEGRGDLQQERALPPTKQFMVTPSLCAPE